MPGGDGTGPMGMGPMTGRAAGYCAGFAVPGFMNPIPGRGFRGWGRGRRRGWRHWFRATGLPGWWQAGMGWPAWGGPWPYGPAYAGAPAPPVTGEQELDALKSQAEHLEDVLEGIKKRIEEFQSQAAEKPEK
jgi:hypothetical protein